MLYDGRVKESKAFLYQRKARLARACERLFDCKVSKVGIDCRDREGIGADGIQRLEGYERGGSIQLLDTPRNLGYMTIWNKKKLFKRYTARQIQGLVYGDITYLKVKTHRDVVLYVLDKEYNILHEDVRAQKIDLWTSSSEYQQKLKMKA